MVLRNSSSLDSDLWKLLWECFLSVSLPPGSSWPFSGPAGELQDSSPLLPYQLPLSVAELEMLSAFIDSQLSDLVIMSL